MAVFTPINENEIHDIVTHHGLGELKSFAGIPQGVDNTNYKIETDSSRYILTIFENRINQSDIPYFLGFMDYLSQNKMNCPKPITNQPVEHNLIHGKPYCLFSFLDGHDVKPEDIIPALCYELGVMLGKMHLAGQKFPMTRENSMSFDAWAYRLDKVERHHQGQASKFLTELDNVRKKWPIHLPTGTVHLDLFPDNVFIKDGHIYAVIDFYFSATDFLAYDLAIVMNAWCFDDTIFNQDRWQHLLNGYESVRKLEPIEKDSYQTLCQGASLRFLSSRLHDFVFHDAKNLVTPKPPSEYISKLEFHQNVDLFTKS
jgi:homoserine kinase type II